MNTLCISDLIYNRIGVSCINSLLLIRNYLNKNDAGYTSKLRSKNVHPMERINLIKDDFGFLDINEYINGGYISKNGDRFVFVNKPEWSDIIDSFSFAHISSGNQANNNCSINKINCFILNTAKLKESYEIFYACYYIIKTYFFDNIDIVSKILDNGPIKKSMFTDYYITDPCMDANIINIMVDFLIAMIIIQDDVFDLKYGDYNDFVKAIRTVDKDKLSKLSILNDEYFRNIYDYAINTDSEEEDYIAIYDKIFKMDIKGILYLEER